MTVHPQVEAEQTALVVGQREIGGGVPGVQSLAQQVLLGRGSLCKSFAIR